MSFSLGIIKSIISWLVAFTAKLGYPGIFLIMAMESSFIPVPSELVIPAAGYLASQGILNPWLVLLSGTLGSLSGALVNYAAAYYLGRRIIKRYGQYFFINARRLSRVEAFYLRHGEISTFSGRFLPIVRHLISIPAGLGRMNVARFSIFTGLGACMIIGIHEYIGFLVGQNMDLVRKYSEEAGIGIIIWLGIILIFYIWWHVRYRQ